MTELQVVPGRLDDPEDAPGLHGSAHGRDRDAAPAAQVLAGERIARVRDLLGRAARHYLTAVHTRARPQIDHVIGLPDRVLVVLHHKHRVAEIAQPDERVEQPLVVTLVQPDRRFVEDVHDAHETRPDLAREPDALRLAAGEGLRAPIKREIVESDVAQEGEAVGDLAHQPLRNLATPALELELREETARVCDRQRGDVRQIPSRDEHVAGGEVEAAAAAIHARACAAIPREFLAYRR